MKYQTEDWIAGVDEAGCGPLAGPVIAAAVILNPQQPIPGIADSKQLTPKRRNLLYERIRNQALAWAVGRAEVEEIDHLNILQARLLAMQRAVQGIYPPPKKALIDGNRCPLLSCPTEAIIGGDRLITAISAASIIAKVTRDREMEDLAVLHPSYGFAIHKGYPTKMHIRSLRELGVCPIHRRSFSPVRSILEGKGQFTQQIIGDLLVS